MLQLRVQRAYPGRVRAGAPVPTRSMSPEEVIGNLSFFTKELEGPRSQGCNGLVMSGVGVASREDVADALRQGREWGIEYVVLHVGKEDLDAFQPERYAGLVDTVVVPVQPGPTGGSLRAGAAAIRRCHEANIRVVANTVLSSVALPDLTPAARAIASAKPHAAAFTYPFPIAGNTSVHVPGVRAAVSALERAVDIIERAGVQVDLKGLPACYLGRLAGRLRRTANRWYVDADHQRGDALLFFPGVVSFTKTDECRFCEMDGACDGFFATYLRRDGFPPLKALTEAAPAG
ncbi:MAG: hypothetical protein H6741_03450 [Alphaproteobacteria bacterium]|nr:hypothetical protein [Alphaproteobacteria bacterium]MCB9791760.1 hypothetical protein [Alphaproteobacteria bacterium]